ncbi:hypothetical protein SAMN05216255_3204 [Pseudomonas segetis]|uniref:Uncharacterized protein n=1 Tax=Pseudomonas segetis TaxID=298908 RepID=A0A239GYK8_9PSED|nr:hypothetical protein SAMN05216255_3204 [Pseudomonas segetis]
MLADFNYDQYSRSYVLELAEPLQANHQGVVPSGQTPL